MTEKVTVYRSSGLGVSTSYGTLVGVRDRPGTASKAVDYIPKGKRKAVGVFANNHKPFVLVLRGEHPACPEGMVPTGGGGKKSRYGAFDGRYETDANTFLNPILDAIDPAAVVLDQRWTKDATEPTIDDL